MPFRGELAAAGARRLLLAAFAFVSLVFVPEVGGQEAVQGRLVGLIIDRQDNTSDERIYVVDDATGRATELVDSHLAIIGSGGLQRLNNRQVVVTGRRLPGDRMQASAVRATEMRPLLDGPSAYIPVGNAVLGPQPIVTILCRFPDLPGLNYDRAHFERVTGNTFPGVGAFVSEASNGQASLAGSQTSDWVTLIKPRTHYFGSGMSVGTGFTSSYTRDITLAEDCAAAAQVGAALPAASGIMLQINYNPGASWAYLSPLPFAGPTISGRLRLAIMANWAAASAGTYAHEVGHSFGLLHSGTAAGVYDSKWDVMSSSSHTRDAASGLVFGTHFNGNHKAFLRWTASSRIADVAKGQTATMSLRSSSQTGAEPALITVADPSDPTVAYFTMEARTRTTPFEQAIPHEGVVLHVVKRQPYTDIAFASNAMAVDGGDVNAATAILVPGRSYDVGGVRIAVTGRVGDVYALDISNRPVFTLLGDSAVNLFPAMTFRDSIRVSGAPGTNVTLAITGQLPPGIVFSSATRTVQGKATAAGTFEYTVAATSGDTSITRKRVIHVYPGSLFRLPAERSYPLGKTIADTLAVYPKTPGWPAPIRWASAGAMPPGMFVQPQTIDGRPDVLGLAGRPTTPGTYRVGAGITHAFGLDTLWFSVNIVGPTITLQGDSVRLPGSVGTPYSDSLRATTTFGSVAWRVKEGALPRGLSFNATGAIRGTPDSAGSYRVVVEGSAGPSEATTIVTQAYLFSVTPPTLTLVSGTTRPEGKMGATYVDSLLASSPYGAVRWKISEGALPSGLTLDSVGVIRGVLESAGQFDLAVTAYVGPPGSVREARLQVGILVRKPLLERDQVMEALLGNQPLTPDLVRFLDLLGNRNGRVDIGDVWAWLVDTGVLQASSSIADVLPVLESAPVPRQ